MSGQVGRRDSVRRRRASAGVVLASLGLLAAAGAAGAGPVRHRLIILADMGNEPDEMQQMAHMLVYANELDLEGLVAVTGKYLRKRPRPKLFHKLIDGYAKVFTNLKIHARGWPTPDYLRGITVAGQNGYGIADVGEGKSSAGSELIVRSVLRKDARPVNIVVNAGSNTLAQALRDFRGKHSQAETDGFVAKLRVYENGAQDNAGAWIVGTFPRIHWLRSNHQTYAYMGPKRKPKDLSRRGPYCWEPYPETNQGQHQWAKEHIQTNHGALGELYPDRFGGRAFLEGGGTTPWMGLVNRGLYDPDHQTWGGWGGRFTGTRKRDVWSRHKDVKRDEEKHAPFGVYDAAADRWTDPRTGKTYDNVYTPVWRWRRAMLNDHRARMDWCVKPYKEANHNPIAALDAEATDATDAIMRRTARPGQVLVLDASASRDPDGDKLEFLWFCYPEAGTYKGELRPADPARSSTRFTVPRDAGGTQIHVVLQVTDRSTIVPLCDYRRIVVDVRR